MIIKSLINIKSKDNITFGILFFTFFLIVGLYPLKSDEIIRVWSIVLSLVFLITLIIKPNLFTPLNRLWIKLGILLGKIMSPIVMCLIFFFVVTPVGMLIRLLKKDTIGLKRGASSYWINRKDKAQSMRKQF
jgi:hypothetical protein